MRPGQRLTQPIVQGIVEKGSSFHSVHGFEWYLSLERWLPLHLSHLRNYRTASYPAPCNQLLSVNQGNTSTLEIKSGSKYRTKVVWGETLTQVEIGEKR